MSKEKSDIVSEATTSDFNKFTKKQLMKSAQYSFERDLLEALLEDEERYSHTEVAELLEQYKKGKVK